MRVKQLELLYNVPCESKGGAGGCRYCMALMASAEAERKKAKLLQQEMQQRRGDTTRLSRLLSVYEQNAREFDEGRGGSSSSRIHCLSWLCVQGKPISFQVDKSYHQHYSFVQFSVPQMNALRSFLTGLVEDPGQNTTCCTGTWQVLRSLCCWRYNALWKCVSYSSEASSYYCRSVCRCNHLGSMIACCSCQCLPNSTPSGSRMVQPWSSSTGKKQWSNNELIATALSIGGLDIICESSQDLFEQIVEIIDNSDLNFLPFNNVRRITVDDQDQRVLATNGDDCAQMAKIDVNVKPTNEAATAQRTVPISTLSTAPVMKVVSAISTGSSLNSRGNKTVLNFS